MKVGGFFVVVLFLAVVTMISGVVLTFFDYTGTTEWTERGVRGDFWGGHLAAAGSMASVFLLILTVMMQRVELHFQREELKATREEMTRGRGVHEEQRNQLSKQVDVARESMTHQRLNELFGLRIQSLNYAKSASQFSQLGKMHFDEDAFKQLIIKHVKPIESTISNVIDSSILTEVDKQCYIALLKHVSVTTDGSY